MSVSAKIIEKLPRIPSAPGVYIFRDQGGNVLYVGKAKVLAHRVRSYFQRAATLEPSKRIMVGRVADLEYIIVDSEAEALLLESTLIKRYGPPFNVIFKDDKYYQYIRIALKEEYPEVDTVRRITKDGGRYFGPFTSGYAVKQTLKLLKRIFPYKACSDPPSRPCFDARLGRCLGHDTGRGSRTRYRKVIRGLIRFLEGHTEEITRGFRAEMRSAAKRHEFERAARLRDRIAAIEKITAEQKVVSTGLEDQDVVGIARIGDVAVADLFQIRTGKLVNRQHHMLQHVEGMPDNAVAASFIEQYYSETADRPRTIVTRSLPPDAAHLSSLIKIRLEAPSRGKKRKLVILAEENARDYLAQRQREWLSKEARAKLGLSELQHTLLFPDPPARIECYDISNVQGTHAVGSMVVFEHGQPKKSDYRKFTLKTVAGSNDYAMLREVLRRRFGHHSLQATSDTLPATRWPNPDLIIIDGGKGQLNAALAVLRELNILIPTIGLAKRLEEIFRPGQKDPLRLTKDSEGLFLLQRIRDEAHRFAIGAYRSRHGRETTRSLLDEVPGIGPLTKKKLLAAFGSVDGIRSADDRAIEKVVGKQKTALLREHL